VWRIGGVLVVGHVLLAAGGMRGIGWVGVEPGAEG